MFGKFFVERNGKTFTNTVTNVAFDGRLGMKNNVKCFGETIGRKTVDEFTERGAGDEVGDFRWRSELDVGRRRRLF